MGRQPAARFALSAFLTSLFCIGYAVAGFTLRNQWWKGIVPLFTVHLVLMNLLYLWLPDLPPAAQTGMSEIARVGNRLNWDARGIVAAIFLGYSCFVYVSVTEARRYFRVHAEMELAAEIHHVIVPQIEMKLGEFEFYGRSLPSSEVGGDLIDVAGSEENWVAYLADVSGHGVAPGVVMGMVKSAARMLLSSGDDSRHLMARLNEVLYPLKKPDMFATFCFVAKCGEGLRVGLAGHPVILRFSARTGVITSLEGLNMPLGILPDGDFATSEIQTESGEMFALYTDGFLEASNAAGEEFGLARLEAELQAHGEQSLEAVYRSVQESVARHGAQFDDQSLLLIRRI
jgi:sigma-B regulation protein RsbU (phosphoserine phosphatase)